MDPEPDPRGPKTCGSGESGTLLLLDFLSLQNSVKIYLLRSVQDYIIQYVILTPTDLDFDPERYRIL